jgi:hypothetical protein
MTSAQHLDVPQAAFAGRAFWLRVDQLAKLMPRV